MKYSSMTQQPGERESYTITYEDALLEGDYLLTAMVKSIAPVGINVDQVTVLSPRVRFFAGTGPSAPTPEGTYKITFTVTSADGRVFEDEVTIKVKEQ